VRAARRVVAVLNTLNDAPDGLTLPELVERTSMPKPTALRYLQTLEEERYVEREPATGRYVLGLAVPAPGHFYAHLTLAARPSLERLNKQFGENALFGILDHGQVAVLDIVESPSTLRVVSNPRERNHLHSTAIGKAIAASLPDDTVRRLLRWRGMPKRTDRTTTDIDAFMDELALVRRRGYATADRENHPDVRSVAVSVPIARVQGVLGMTGPAVRFSLTDAPRVSKALQREAANIVEALLAESSA
jgi:IclR family transcriptional regulator, acetate operon repressor